MKYYSLLGLTVFTLSTSHLSYAQETIAGNVNSLGGVFEKFLETATDLGSNILSKSPLDFDLSLPARIADPQLVAAALDDLETIQETLGARTGVLRNALVPLNAQGNQILKTLGPFDIAEFSKCMSNLTPGVISGKGENLLDATNIPVLRDMLKSLAALKVSNVLPISLRNADLTELQQTISPCQALLGGATGNGSVEALLSLITDPSETTHVVGDTARASATRVNDLLQERARGFDTFVKTLTDVLRARLYERDNSLESIIDNTYGALTSTYATESDLAMKTLGDGFDYVQSGLGTSLSSLSNTVNLKPTLYAWLEIPSQIRDDGNLALRGLVKPLEGLTQIRTAIVPEDLGKDIELLSQVDPRLSGFFEYFNNAAAAPTILTLKTLLDSISTTGTLGGLERFNVLLKPYEGLAQPLGLKLGVANACLDYLHTLLPLSA